MPQHQTCGIKSNLNHAHLREIIKEATDQNSSHLLIMGDFNYSDINWRLDITPADLNHPSTMFRECLRDNFLFQHVYDPTHFRGSQTPNTLDLIVTNEEGMINKLELAAPIRKKNS